MQIIAQPKRRHLLLSFVKDHPMNIRKLGAAGPATSALGLGCMGMSDLYGPSDRQESLATMAAAALPEPYASLAGRGITNLTGPFGEMIANDVLPGQSK